MMSARLIVLVVTVASADYNINDIMSQQGHTAQQVQSSNGLRGWNAAPVVQQDVTPVVQNSPSADMTTLEASIQHPAAAPSNLPVFGQSAPLDAKPLNGALAQDSMAVVSGLIEAFMHKVKLEPGEMSCLERNIGQLTGDIMGTVGDVVTAIEALIQGKGSIQQQQTGGVVSAGIDSAMKITSLVALSTQFVKNCVHGDSLALLKLTANHLANGTYIEHRFLVNGVDIARSLSDSVVAFESKDFHRFGSDIGVALRKILLSSATHGKGFKLPEGMPEEKVVQQCTDGLMRGFFVEGSAVEITDTAHPDIDIVINLHQCIAGNSVFFKELWLAAWNLIAQLSMNADQHQLGTDPFGQAFQGNGKQPKWAGEFMVAMMQFPMALSRCGVDQGMQDMFMEAIKSLNDLRVQVRLPDDRFRAANDQTKTEETTARMAKAVEAFTKWDFEDFGFEIGKMLRELVMLAFPQKYGTVGTVAMQRKYSEIKPFKLREDRVPEAVAIIGGAVVSAMIIKFAVVVVRLRPSNPTERNPSATADVEGGEAPALD